MPNDNINSSSSSRPNPPHNGLEKPRNPTLNLTELLKQASAILSKQWTRIEKIPGGTNHELYTLFFEGPSTPGKGPPPTEWSCIARFPRHDTDKTLAMLKSELTTMRHVTAKTVIPIPKIYHSDLDPANKVGAPYMLLEHLPGRNLHDVWHDPATTFAHKQSIVTQVTGILAQLSMLQFQQIGSLVSSPDTNGGDITVGPLLDTCYASKSCGPFDSTLAYLTSYMPPEAEIGADPILQFLFRHIRHRLEDYLSRHANESHIAAPFRLIHGNLTSPNILFVPGTSPGSAPKLSGVIDWEDAYVGPLYNLYEYPLFLHDSESYPEHHGENERLRAHFVRALVEQWGKGGVDAEVAEKCMKEKCHLLNRFMWVFMYAGDNGLEEAERYMMDMRRGKGKAYSWSSAGT
jgi:hypothetical protein